VRPPVGWPGVNSLTVNGVVHHHWGPLQAAEGVVPEFGQIYFCAPNNTTGDSAAELAARVTVSSGWRGGRGLNHQTIAALQHMLHRDNHFVRTFKAAMSEGDADTPQVNVTIETNGRDIRQATFLPANSFNDSTRLPAFMVRCMEGWSQLIPPT
jgi:hypothetical protein